MIRGQFCAAFIIEKFTWHLGESIRKIEVAVYLGESVSNLIPRKAPLIYGWPPEDVQHIRPSSSIIEFI